VVALAAALVKPPAVLVFVALLASLFWRRRWRPMLAGLALGVAMLATTSALLYPAGEPVFTPLLQSPNDAAQRMLRDAGMGWPRMLTLALLAALAAFTVWRLVASTARDAVVVNAGLLTMGLLLALHQMVYPWYVTWLVPYAALFDGRRLRLVILAYSFTVFTMYWTTSVLIPVGTELHAGTRFLSMGLAHAPLLLGLKAMLPDAAGQGRQPAPMTEGTAPRPG
jgi:hypothetical protein